MPHHRNNRRTTLQIFWVFFTKKRRNIPFHQVRNRNIFRNFSHNFDAKSFTHEITCIKINRGIKCYENSIFHQFSDNLRNRNTDFIRKFFYRNIFWNRNFLPSLISQHLRNFFHRFFFFLFGIDFFVAAENSVIQLNISSIFVFVVFFVFSFLSSSITNWR